MTRFDVAMVGGGMIARDQILPSLYQLRRLGLIGEITVCARHEETLRLLAGDERICEAFPAQSFREHIGAYADVIAQLPKRNIVVVALPDHLHFDAVMTALKADQHVLVVKPLVLHAAEAAKIAEEARRRALLVAIEYHKRFDDRSLMARRKYRAGDFGEFKLGAAVLMEKWHYRHSNFQNWFTTENSDAFTYIGCHYVDLVHFITGLLPHSLSVYGMEDTLPNGKPGYLWTDARLIWDSGACLNVQNSLSFPDEAPGTNTQGLTMYFSNGERGGYLRHDDQYRGIQYVSGAYSEPSPDYFQYVAATSGGLMPVGYGYRSIEAIIRTCARVEQAEDPAAVLREIDVEGILATPSNSSYNEQVIEAGRKSILSGGAMVPIETAS
ncbi:MAG: Gfo/Idh/MocA family protein [Bryobacteraceae bacterium]